MFPEWSNNSFAGGSYLDSTLEVKNADLISIPLRDIFQSKGVLRVRVFISFLHR